MYTGLLQRSACCGQRRRGGAQVLSMASVYEYDTHMLEWPWYLQNTYSYNLSRFALGLVTYKVLEPLATAASISFASSE